MVSQEGDSTFAEMSSLIGRESRQRLPVELRAFLAGVHFSVSCANAVTSRIAQAPVSESERS